MRSALAKGADARGRSASPVKEIAAEKKDADKLQIQTEEKGKSKGKGKKGKGKDFYQVWKKGKGFKGKAKGKGKSVKGKGKIK